MEEMIGLSESFYNAVTSSSESNGTIHTTGPTVSASHDHSYASTIPNISSVIAGLSSLISVMTVGLMK